MSEGNETPAQARPGPPAVPTSQRGLKAWIDGWLPLTAAFIAGLLFGWEVKGEQESPNHPGDVTEFDELSLRLVVEEGRRQIDNQSERFKHTTDRAQVVVTVSLLALPFWVGLFSLARKSRHWQEWVSGGLWVLAGFLLVCGLAAAAAVAVTKANFEAIDTTQITTWDPPVLRRMAMDYAGAVRLGEGTVADRVTVFRQATRLLVWGAIFAALAAVVALS